MAPTDLSRLAVVVVAAAVGGAMNSIAGGGTLLTFPALVGLGIPAIVANATSTVALWPGTVGSVLGYLGELRGARSWAIRFAVPSVFGGLVGALLLIRTSPARFDAIVPWLVLGSTSLFVLQRPLMRWLRSRVDDATTAGDLAHDPTLRPPPYGVLLYQFTVSIYGGYFGAGIGILMLAALGFMGFTNIHRMNGLKNWCGLCTNLIAAMTFALSNLITWPVAMAMAVGAIAGGYGGSRMAQRVPQERVRQAIVVIGFSSTLWLMFGRQ